MKTHLFLLHLLFLGAMVPAHAAPLPAVHGRVYGQDEKGANLGPLPGAKIELLSGQGGIVIATTTADSPGGYYQIKDLPPADYAYRVTSAGFKTEDAKRGFKVPQNSLEYVHDFILTKPPAKRERCDVPVLIVKRLRTGDKPDESVRLPVAGARMILRPTSTKIATPPNQPFVGSDKGELTLKGLAAGDYDVSIDAPECQPLISQLKVVCKNNDQIIFELQACDEALHSLVRTLLRDGWGGSPQAKAAAARAMQALPKTPNKENGSTDYAQALTQLSAGSYDTALTTLAGVTSRQSDSPAWDHAAGTRLWMLLCLHQPSQAMKEARSLAKNHYATRAATPASRDTAQVCGLAIGLMRGPWEADVGKSEASAFERDLLGSLQGELRAECEKTRNQVAAEYAKLKTAMDSARSKIMVDAGTRQKEELARIESRQAVIAREVKALDAEIQKGQGMSKDDEQLRIQLTGFTQQRQALAVRIRTLQARLQQLAAKMSQGGRQVIPPPTQPGFPQGDPRRGKVPGRMPTQPQQQPPQVNPQLQIEMQQVQNQLAVLQQQDAQLAASMVNLQNRAQRPLGGTEAELAAKRQRREALAREFDTLDQQRAAPFDPAMQTTPEISSLVRRARLVKTYRDLPLEMRRQQLFDLFTCGASKDPPRTVPGASTKPVEIIEKDFPPPRQAAR